MYVVMSVKLLELKLEIEQSMKEKDITQGTQAVKIHIKGRLCDGKFLWFVMPPKSKQRGYNFLVSLCGISANLSTCL